MSFRVLRSARFPVDIKARIVVALLMCVWFVSGCSTLGTYTAHQSVTHTSSKKADNDHNDHNVYQLMGKADAAYNSENWAIASTAYRKVLEIIPNDAYAWFRMGNSLTQLGQYHKAVVAYETSLAADNGQFKAWFNLSTTHLLNAKVVTLNALRSIATNDPSRSTVVRRLDILTALLN